MLAFVKCVEDDSMSPIARYGQLTRRVATLALGAALTCTTRAAGKLNNLFDETEVQIPLQELTMSSAVEQQQHQHPHMTAFVKSPWQKQATPV